MQRTANEQNNDNIIIYILSVLQFMRDNLFQATVSKFKSINVEMQ